MSRKRFTAEQIIGLLWEGDVKLSQGKNAGQVSRDRIIQVIWLNEGSCIRLRPQTSNLNLQTIAGISEEELIPRSLTQP
jgi:hypothetical protein